MSPDTSQRPLVFVIEDDREFGAYLAELLEDIDLASFEVFTDGLEGLRACLHHSPNVVVLDLNLPSLRGEEICRVLRSSPAHRAVRIMVCSDMPEAQRRELELLQIGADVYFEKPFVESRFIHKLTRLIQESRDTSETEENRPTARSASGLLESAESEVEVPEETRPDDVTKISPPPPDPPPPYEPIAEPHPPGELFEGYELLDVLGGGAVGTVYRARQTNLGRIVALKVFLRHEGDAQETLDRFQREAIIMGQLDHPNILRIFDAGNTGYTYFIATELMEGSLHDLIDNDEVTVDVCREIIRQACDALIYLHAQGIIHRDIKPGNILTRGKKTFKLGDFGISRARLDIDQTEFTRQHTLLGTRSYMAPELLIGVRANELTDQYALGRTILRLFEKDNIRVPPRPLREVAPHLPRSLSDSIDRCLQLDPRQRFPDMREARAALLAGL